MKTGQEFLRERWCEVAGVAPPGPMPDLEELRKSEWSEEFERLCRNRMVMGAFRYGRLGAPCKPQWDRVTAVRRHMDAYEADGNLEHLVDVANMVMLEFVEGRHPRRHFRSMDDKPENERVQQCTKK